LREDADMPWVVPAHQAPALLLKARWPRAFSGLALCLGTAVPDLEFIWRITPDWPLGHTWLAQVYVTAPLTVALHALTTRLVLPWLIPLLPAGPPFHPEDLQALKPARTRAEWLRIAWSGSVGGLTHVFLDGFTHGNHSGWAVPYLPWLRASIALPGGERPLHDLLQILLTILLGATAFRLWGWLATRGRLWAWSGAAQPVVPAASVPSRRRAMAILSLSLLAGVAAGACAPPGPPLELAAYGALTFVSAAAVGLAVFDRVRALRAARVAWRRPGWAS
jgi:Domain of unknown function (DUF4184)